MDQNIGMGRNGWRKRDKVQSNFACVQKESFNFQLFYFESNEQKTVDVRVICGE